MEFPTFIMSMITSIFVIEKWNFQKSIQNMESFLIKNCSMFRAVGFHGNVIKWTIDKNQVKKLKIVYFDFPKWALYLCNASILLWTDDNFETIFFKLEILYKLIYKFT